MLGVSSLSLASNRVGTHPPGWVDKTVTGASGTGSYQVTPPAGDVQERGTRQSTNHQEDS